MSTQLNEVDLSFSYARKITVFNGPASIASPVCTIHTRASGVGRFGVHLTVHIKSIDPLIGNLSTGMLMVIAQMSVLYQ